MLVTKRISAEKIAAYLRREIVLADLVDWAERVLMEQDFDAQDAAILSRVVARLGVSDVRAFGLTWEDCQQLLGELGFAARVEVVAA